MVAGQAIGAIISIMIENDRNLKVTDANTDASISTNTETQVTTPARISVFLNPFS